MSSLKHYFIDIAFESWYLILLPYSVCPWLNTTTNNIVTEKLFLHWLSDLPLLLTPFERQRPRQLTQHRKSIKNYSLKDLSNVPYPHCFWKPTSRFCYRTVFVLDWTRRKTTSPQRTCHWPCRRSWSWHILEPCSPYSAARRTGCWGSTPGRSSRPNK